VFTWLLESVSRLSLRSLNSSSGIRLSLVWSNRIHSRLTISPTPFSARPTFRLCSFRSKPRTNLATDMIGQVVPLVVEKLSCQPFSAFAASILPNIAATPRPQSWHTLTLAHLFLLAYFYCSEKKPTKEHLCWPSVTVQPTTSTSATSSSSSSSGSGSSKGSKASNTSSSKRPLDDQEEEEEALEREAPQQHQPSSKRARPSTPSTTPSLKKMVTLLSDFFFFLWGGARWWWGCRPLHCRLCGLVMSWSVAQSRRNHLFTHTLFFVFVFGCTG